MEYPTRSSPRGAAQTQGSEWASVTARRLLSSPHVNTRACAREQLERQLEELKQQLEAGAQHDQFGSRSYFQSADSGTLSPHSSQVSPKASDPQSGSGTPGGRWSPPSPLRERRVSFADVEDARSESRGAGVDSDGVEIKRAELAAADGSDGVKGEVLTGEVLTGEVRKGEVPKGEVLTGGVRKGDVRAGEVQPTRPEQPPERGGARRPPREASIPESEHINMHGTYEGFGVLHNPLNHSFRDRQPWREIGGAFKVAGKYKPRRAFRGGGAADPELTAKIEEINKSDRATWVPGAMPELNDFGEYKPILGFDFRPTRKELHKGPPTMTSSSQPWPEWVSELPPTPGTLRPGSSYARPQSTFVPSMLKASRDRTAADGSRARTASPRQRHPRRPGAARVLRELGGGGYAVNGADDVPERRGVANPQQRAAAPVPGLADGARDGSQTERISRPRGRRAHFDRSRATAEGAGGRRTPNFDASEGGWAAGDQVPRAPGSPDRAPPRMCYHARPLKAPRYAYDGHAPLIQAMSMAKTPWRTTDKRKFITKQGFMAPPAAQSPLRDPKLLPPKYVE